MARPGDAVLLAACASLDMFRNYAHRAEVFVDAVRRLPGEPAMKFASTLTGLPGAKVARLIRARRQPGGESPGARAPTRELDLAADLVGGRPAAARLVMVYSASIAIAEGSRFRPPVGLFPPPPWQSSWPSA